MKQSNLNLLEEVLLKIGSTSNLSQKITDVNFYGDLVIDTNKKFNLLAPIEEDQFLIKHILDSTVVFPYFKGFKSIMDIGTGAGFPGMVLAILGRELNQTIYLVESKKKKADFLKRLVSELNLKNVQVIESNIKEVKVQVDVITCRAFATFKKVFSLTKHQHKANYFFLKATKAKIEDEILEVKQRPDDIISLFVPHLSAERHLVTYRKNVLAP